MSKTANQWIPNFPTLASIIDRQPLIVAPDLSLREVIALMSQAQDQICLLPNSNITSDEVRSPAQAISIAARHSAVLVTNNDRLVGIFTERNLVKLSANQTDLDRVKVGDVMIPNPQTLLLTDNHTVMTALEVFQQYQIRHLPILDDRQQLIGIVTPEHIRQVLQPVNLLKYRLVLEGMTTEVIHATPTTTILEIARMMIDHQIGSIVIVDPQERLRPLGIVTERDIVQFQAFELDLDELLAQDVMSSPLFCLKSTDSFWAAQQIMQTKNIRRLVITNDRGDLAGILTQSNLLQWLNPLEMLTMVEKLQTEIVQRSKALEQSNRELRREVIRRQQVEAELERRVVERTAELAMRTQQIEEQAALLDITTDAIIVCDLNNQIQFWNKGAESIYGWQAAEAIGQQTTQLFYTDIPVEVSNLAAKVREIGSCQGELHKLTKTGQTVIVESRWTLVCDEVGNPRSILSVDTDITEKKSLEQQFLRAQRLESLGSLASGIAHDLNNVLTPILGAAQLLPLTLPNLDARNQRLLSMLLDSAKRGSGLVKQILSFARGEDGERSVLQARHILAEIISVARQTFPKSIKISLDLDYEDLWLVNADATQLHQVLMNLFVNARDAMPDGGEIIASASNIVLDATDPKSHLHIPIGAYIKIGVADTGIGMTQETIAQIFTPFFTTKQTGTGLGLSTVLGIVKAHGGAVEVESEVGHGSCFQIYLPAIVSKADPAPAVGVEQYDGKGQLVLVVDDEAAIREIAKASLEMYNYRVITASDGIEAIDIYTHNYPSIAIVLIDMIMPKLDTRSAIRALQRINSHMKFVVMSGSDLDLEVTFTKQPLGTVLTKPFTTPELLQTLAQLRLE